MAAGDNALYFSYCAGSETLTRTITYADMSRYDVAGQPHDAWQAHVSPHAQFSPQQHPDSIALQGHGVGQVHSDIGILLHAFSAEEPLLHKTLNDAGGFHPVEGNRRTVVKGSRTLCDLG